VIDLHSTRVAAGRKHLPSLVLRLWITIDLDHPRAGLMEISDAPLEALTSDGPQE
jgi:hypothetical protein